MRGRAELGPATWLPSAQLRSVQLGVPWGLVSLRTDRLKMCNNVGQGSSTYVTSVGWFARCNGIDSGKQVVGGPTPTLRECSGPFPLLFRVPTLRISLRVCCSLFPCSSTGQSLQISGYDGDNDAHICHLCAGAALSAWHPLHSLLMAPHRCCYHQRNCGSLATSEGMRLILTPPLTCPTPIPGLGS